MNKVVIVLILGVGSFAWGNGLLATLLSLLSVAEGFSDASTGMVMSGFAVGMLSGSLLAPAWIRRFGPMPVFHTLLILAAIAALPTPFFPNSWFWFLLRFCLGLTFGGISVIVESWINLLAPNHQRGQLLGAYVMVQWFGASLIQFILPLVTSVHQPFWYIISSIFLIAGSLPLLLTPILPPAPSTIREKMPWRDLWHMGRLSVVGTFANGLFNGSLLSLAAVYAARAQFSSLETSTFIAAYLIGGALCQWPIAWLSDRFPRPRVLLAILIIIAILSLCAWLIPDHMRPWMFPIAFLIGGVGLQLYPVSLSIINDRLPKERMVSASALLIILSGLGAIIGPVLTGLTMNLWGYQGYFLYAMAIALFFAMFCVWSILTNKTQNIC